MTDHDRYGELVAPYVFGTLTPEERLEMDRHVAGCPDCLGEIRDAAVVMEGLGRAVAPQEPPPGLRDRVMAAALASSPGGTRDGGRSPHVAAKQTIAPWLLAAAAAIATIGVGLYAANLQLRLRETNASLQAAQARLSTLEAQMVALRQVRDEGMQAAEVLAAPDVIRVELAGQPSAPEAKGRAFWSPSRGLVVAARNMPPLPAGRTYQLWVVTAAAPVSAGLLRPDDAGRLGAAIRVTAVRPTAIALTIEPAGGVPAPTGPMYLVGSL